MRFAIAVLLEDDAHNFARKVELELYDMFGLIKSLKIAPHITVEAPFVIDRINLIEEYLDEFILTQKSFEIEIDGFNYFDEHVIYLDVMKNPDLINLHLKLLKGLKEKFKINESSFEGVNSKFHSTVAYKDLDTDTFQKAKKCLEKYTPNFKFPTKQLGLLYNIGDKDGWVIAKKYSIGGII